MDAKFFSDRGFRFSGSQLFLGLGIALSVGSLLLDSSSGRSFWSIQSLTLPLWVCTLAAAMLGSWVVPLLRDLKAGQVIREDGPQSHLKKAGTPTMGGLFFVPVSLAIAVLWSGFSTQVLGVAALTLAYAGIGWLDDWQILRYKSNKGISPRTKLALQITFSVLFCLWALLTQPASLTSVALPFGWVIPLGILFWPLAGFVLVAESNATNLTDGVDGLAGGTVAIALLGLGAFIAPTHPDLALFAACLSGGCLGFLAHNHNPARVFMGDTGSLALGGALGAIAILSNTLWVLLIVGAIFLVETLSVIAQVTYYKATKGPDGIGKRLFKMSPFHNHLELSGWSETQIVAAFYGISAALAGLCLLLR